MKGIKGDFFFVLNRLLRFIKFKIAKDYASQVGHDPEFFWDIGKFYRGEGVPKKGRGSDPSAHYVTEKLLV